jgi:hypothetical protein
MGEFDELVLEIDGRPKRGKSSPESASKTRSMTITERV